MFLVIFALLPAVLSTTSNLRLSLEASGPLDGPPPKWYKNFPPWWMNPGAMKTLAKDYTNTLESAAPISLEKSSKNAPSSPYGMMLKKPGGLNEIIGAEPRAAPVGNPIVPDPSVKPITTSQFYGPAVNALLAGTNGGGQKIFDGVIGAKGTNEKPDQEWTGTLLGNLKEMKPPTEGGADATVDTKTPQEAKEELKGGIDVDHHDGEKHIDTGGYGDPAAEMSNSPRV